MLQALPRFASRYSVPSAVVLALAAMLLMVAVAWAVLAAGWVVQGGGGAVVVAVAATAEASLLAQARVARIVTVALAPVLALAAIVPTTLGAMPYDGDGTLGHTVARYAGALLGGINSSSDWAFTVGLCGVLWLTGYWLGWMALRERQGVLGVLPLYAILATNVVNSHNPNAVALPEGIAVALSLVVIAATHLDAVESRWGVSAVHALPRTRTRFAATVVVAVAALTAASLLIPPATTGDISARFFPGSKPGTGNGGIGAATIEFNPGTIPGGALVSHPVQVLTYSTDTAEPVYLRVVDDTQFVNGNWYPDEGGEQLASGLTHGGIRFPSGTLPRDLSAAGGAGMAASATVHADMTAQPGATGSTSFGLFTGEPLSSDHAGIVFGIGPSSHNGPLYTVEDVELTEGGSSTIHVKTSALVSTATEDQLRNAGRSYPAFVQHYTRLPDDGAHQSATIAELAAQWTQGTTNAYDAATAIESHLRDPRFFQYTLSPPAPPSGVWPIVYFLTQSHRGYCQYFASAMGAMLRSLGIPTRLVSGYGPGTPEGTTGGRQGARQQVVTTSDAHTWVEAFFPGYGWIPFEPTPPSVQGIFTPFPRGEAAVTGVANSGSSATPAPANTKPGFNDPIPAAGLTVNGGTAASPAVVTGIVAGAIVALLGAYVLWLLLPRSPRGAWLRLEIVGGLRGARRRPAETHREYAERFGARFPRAATPARDLAALLARGEFSAAGADTASRRRALAEWRRIAAGVPSQLLGRLDRSRARRRLRG
ncbi:MAG TPA: transglutaminaseTgpA domain-containing protein [Candidatus Dormibacteraeota bacterium]